MGKQTILVVDDTESSLKLTRDIFEISGFDVITAEDGEQAFSILAQRKTDLVITDILMPNVDGYELCYTIKTSEELRDLPVIIYSATFTTSSDEEMAVETGADKFIRKPAPISELIQAARALLSDPAIGRLKLRLKPESLKATRLYNTGLINKLERRNRDAEDANERLQRSESRLKAAQTMAHMGSWEIDLEKQTHQWSDELFAIFGTARDDTLPSTDFFLSFVHPEDFECAKKNMETAFETFTDSSFDFRFVNAEGQLRYGYSFYRFEFNREQIATRLYGIIQDVTEKRLADEALLSVHERLLFHIESTRFGFIEYDNEYKIKVWSKTAEQIFGWSQEELTKHRISGLRSIFEADTTWMNNVVNQLLHGEITRNRLQYRSYTKSGKVIWCESFNSVIHDSHGNVTTIMSLVQDVTEGKEAEQQREFDRNNLTALLNNTNDLIWSVDRGFRIITSNHAFDEMVRVLSGSVVAKGSDVLRTGFTEKQNIRFKKYYERAFAGEIFTEIEYTFSPVEIWSEVSYYPIYKGKEVVGTACFSHNVTERKRSENHLLLLESVITNTHDAVLITEADPVSLPGPKIVYVNHAFTEMTGYESCEVIGKTPRILQGPKSDRLELDRIQGSFGERKGIEVEIVNYKKNGEEFWNNFTIVPVMAGTGVIKHYISIQRDVTERRKHEEFARMKLERLVRERTLELHEALKAEKELVEMKGKFVTIASHEFRTPLATISFAAESIRNYFSQLSPSEIAKKLIKIEDQAMHMTRLLEDILMLGKSETGKIKVKRVNIDLKEFIESIIEEVLAVLKIKRQINFLFTCAVDSIYADDKLLRNVFNNLLSNALKFSSAPVSVAVSNFEGDILIVVADEGIGIEESERESIFESFQRGSNAASVPGTGLGLSILKKAVELMDGSVEVKSTLGKGSVFSVLIPAR